jgi:hypothetical protein
MDMTTDLLTAIAGTASAALVIWGLSSSLAASPRGKAIFAFVLAAWFSAAVAVGAAGVLMPDRLGTPGVGAAVLLPILIAAWLSLQWTSLKQALLGIPLAVFIAVNAVRVFGLFFVIHYAEGRLPAPFAPSAGWGDVFVGATALPVAWLVARRANGWRAAALVWNTIGFADLVLAVALGIMSAQDSPMQLFAGGPDTTLMAMLPMFLIPGFLVPLLMLTHLAVLQRLAAGDEGSVRLVRG